MSADERLANSRKTLDPNQNAPERLSPPLSIEHWLLDLTSGRSAALFKEVIKFLTVHIFRFLKRIDSLGAANGHGQTDVKHTTQYPDEAELNEVHRNARPCNYLPIGGSDAPIMECHV